MPAPALTHGWQPGSDRRGTADILWSCSCTIILCLWTMLHLNLPAPNDGFRTVFFRKARWLLLGILAPEVPMLIACGQWSSAKRSVEEMGRLGFCSRQWTLAHAFFADSGGILLKWDEQKIFPITSKQIACLIRKNCINLPTITYEDIMDKSNADTITKILATTQAGWLLIQIVARAASNLPVTPVELASAAIALTALSTLVFWMEKPLDVQTPYDVNLLKKPDNANDGMKFANNQPQPVAMVDGLRSLESEHLPLDYIEPDVYLSRKWSKTVFSWICRAQLQNRELDRIPNDRDPQVFGLSQHIALGFVTAAFASIHFIDWHFQFATLIEMWIWRGNCVLMWTLLATYGTAEVVICTKEGYSKMGLDTAGGYKKRFPACLWFFIPGGLYFIARLLLICSALTGLRTLPEAAFQELQWINFLPHL